MPVPSHHYPHHATPPGGGAAAAPGRTTHHHQHHRDRLHHYSPSSSRSPSSSSSSGGSDVRGSDFHAVSHHSPSQRRDRRGGHKVVAGYVLTSRLGSGSFATVYKGVRLHPTPHSQSNSRHSGDANSRHSAHSAHSGAHDASSGAASGENAAHNSGDRDDSGDDDEVAIKAIVRSSEKITAKVLDNLQLEISILRTHQHNNVVALHSVHQTSHHVYLVLEYCAGGDLQKLIRSRKKGRLSERLTRRLTRDLKEGLKFLWTNQLIHRDLKPQNLLLTGPLPLDEVHDPSVKEDEERHRREVDFPSGKFALKIADFGFARHLQSTNLAETLCGSPLYMAPEILQHHRYDAKADLWSAGTVLFEMISGRPPFHGENHIDLLRNIQRKAVRLPPDVRVSKECVYLLRILLSRNPLSRAGFQEFFDAADAFVALGCEGEVVMDTKQQPAAGYGTATAAVSSAMAPPSSMLQQLGPISEDDSSPGDEENESPSTAPLAGVVARQETAPFAAGATVPSPQGSDSTGVEMMQRQGQTRQLHPPNQAAAPSPATAIAPSTSHYHGAGVSSAPAVATAAGMVTPPLGPAPAPTQAGYLVPAGPPQLTLAAPASHPPSLQTPSYSSPSYAVPQRVHPHQFAPLQPSPPPPPSRRGGASVGYDDAQQHLPPPAFALDGGLPHPLPSPMTSGSGGYLPSLDPRRLGHPTTLAPYHHNQQQPQQQQQTAYQPPAQHQERLPPPQQQSKVPPESSASSDEFVMVEHGAASSSTSSSRQLNAFEQAQQQGMVSTTLTQQQPPPSYYGAPSDNKFFTKGVPTLIPPARADARFSSSASAPYNASRGGMLSTSPGTGGALVQGMTQQQQQQQPSLSLPSSATSSDHASASQGQQEVEKSAKMLSTAEDVGRRAVNVAHLGDTRAYLAMTLMLRSADEEGSSGVLSASPMEGVEEEKEEGESSSHDVTDTESSSSSSSSSVSPSRGAPTRASAATAYRNPRRHSRQSRREKVAEVSQNEEGTDDINDEMMPFAISEPEEKIQLMLPSLPAAPKPDEETPGSASKTTQQKSITPAQIQAHFREALSCYLKALSMLKGSVSAAQTVLQSLSASGPSPNQDTNSSSHYYHEDLLKRCQVSLSWLTGQFTGVLERANAANVEIAKLQEQQAQKQKASPASDDVPEATNLTTNMSLEDHSAAAVVVISVEELIYNHSLACGRDGAVKQLLGQYGRARASYRAAGLLAETLLMEPRLGPDDKAVLEGYVRGFAERITELDAASAMMHHRPSLGSVGSTSSSAVVGAGGESSRRGSGVVGLIGGMP